MPYLEKVPRVGRSQGASIFWGLVSVFFAAAACFYFWKNHENEINANKLRDEVLFLQDERDTLKSQKEKLQANMSDADNDLKTRDAFLKEKEAALAAKETSLEALQQKTQSQAQPGQSQASAIKKFGDALRKLGQNGDADVVARNGRPVLRVPNAVMFAPGDATLTTDGKTLLTQVAQAFSAPSDNFELRVESFTETDAEATTPSDGPPPKPSNVQKKDPDAKTPAPDADTKPHFANSWELTAARAAAIARFFRDQTTLPFQNVLVIARGDSQPIVPAGKDGHLRNRRIEITLTPLPVVSQSKTADANPLAPPPDPPAPANKAK